MTEREGVLQQRPTTEFPCPTCNARIVLTDGQVIGCCGRIYRLELTIHQESEAEWRGRRAANAAAIQRLETDEVTFPRCPACGAPINEYHWPNCPVMQQAMTEAKAQSLVPSVQQGQEND